MAGHLFLYPLLIGLLLLHSSSADPLFQHCGVGNYTANSTYQSNLNHLLTFFTSLSSTFSTHTQGSAPDTVYGLFLCRGDVSPSDCSYCIENAAQDVLSLCPSSKQATIWYDYCELRYSNIRFFGFVDNSNAPILINVRSFTKKEAKDFLQLEGDLLDKLTDYAAYSSSLMFATGTAVKGSRMKVNGLAQCTRDLSRDSCSRCFQEIRADYTGYEVRVGGRVLGKSCNFRYEVYSFYQGYPTILLNFTAPPPLPPSTSPAATLPLTPPV